MVYIYKATFPSGKYYIGLTNNFAKRKRDHLADAFNIKCSNYKSAFKSAIRKYGANTIKWSIVDTAVNYDVASELEKRYILHFDSYDNGYNMTLGGEEGHKYTICDLIEQAKKYKTRLEWHKFSGSTYLSAKGYGNDFFEKCCTHMPKPHYWSEGSILELLKEKEYKNVEEWKKDNNGSKKAAEKISKEFYNECKKKLKARKIWTKEEIKNSALHNMSKHEWFKRENNAYQAAKRISKAFFEECVAHMNKR